MSYIGKKNGNPNTDFLDAGGELEYHDLVTVDSSGNVGIGTSSPAKPLQVNGDDTAPIRVVRETGDGHMIQLYKDSSSFANIGTNSGQPYFVNSSNKGIRLYTNGFAAAGGDGSFEDAAQDLGASTVRWRNLYLSGGVYLGGTGSANYLDDYEEGSWTPTLDGSTGSPTVSYGSQTAGSYTKIGNLVHARGTVQIATISGGSGSALIDGLPFTVSSNINTYAARSGGVVISQADNFTSGNYPSHGQVSIASDYFYLRQLSSGTTSLTVAVFQTNTLVRFSVTYPTNS